jgi:hypothetical protein
LPLRYCFNAMRTLIADVLLPSGFDDGTDIHAIEILEILIWTPSFEVSMYSAFQKPKELLPFDIDNETTGLTIEMF